MHTCSYIHTFTSIFTENKTHTVIQPCVMVQCSFHMWKVLCYKCFFPRSFHFLFYCILWLEIWSIKISYIECPKHNPHDDIIYTHPALTPGNPTNSPHKQTEDPFNILHKLLPIQYCITVLPKTNVLGSWVMQQKNSLHIFRRWWVQILVMPQPSWLGVQDSRTILSGQEGWHSSLPCQSVWDYSFAGIWENIYAEEGR